MAKYDPNKQYKWDEETEFNMSGNEFGLILNTLRTVLGTPEAQKILLMNQANDTIEEVLKRYVETGQIKEIVEEYPEMKAPQPPTADLKKISKSVTKK